MKDLVHRRGGSENWYVRVQIPLESQAVLGKKEIWRSLRTTDLKQARKFAHAKIAEIQREIEIALKSAPRTATRADLEDAVRRFYLGEVESDQHERSYDIGFVRERLARDPQAYRKHVEELRISLAGMDFEVVAPDAEHVLDMENLRLSKDSPLYMEFLHLLMRARVEAAKRWAEHDQAIFGEEPGDRFFRVPPKPLPEEAPVIPPFLAGCIRRIHAAIFSFMAGVMPPMPMFGRSLL